MPDKLSEPDLSFSEDDEDYDELFGVYTDPHSIHYDPEYAQELKNIRIQRSLDRDQN
tara:strand:- start:251 stop:421 length:171 start_codon:yes stop_codon:yes gene_type:complete